MLLLLLHSVVAPKTFVLKMNIHCGKCEKDVKRWLQKINGVDSVSVDADQGKVTVSGTADPHAAILILKENNKTAELLCDQQLPSNLPNSEQAKPLRAPTIYVEKDQASEHKANPESPTQLDAPRKFVLGLHIHCESSERKLKKFLQTTNGVNSVDVDADQGKVTILASVDPHTIIAELKSKLKKKAELVWEETSTTNYQEPHIVEEPKPVQVTPADGHVEKEETSTENACSRMSISVDAPRKFVLGWHINCKSSEEKLKKFLQKTPGVNSVSIDADQGKVDVLATVDPRTIIIALESKYTRKKAELIWEETPHANNQNPHIVAEQKPVQAIIHVEEEETSKQNACSAMQIWVAAPKNFLFKLHIDCDNCEEKVKTSLQKIPGVISVTIDREQGRVTVVATTDPQTVIKGLHKDAGKKAELLQKQIAPMNNQNTQVIAQPKQAQGKQNSIGVATTKGNQPKHKLELKIYEEPYTCHVCNKSQDLTITKGSHPSHPHELELKNYEKQYKCDGCKEPGIGPRYRCDPCNYELHKDCFNSELVFNESSTGSAFTFLPEPPDESQSYCLACGKAITGFTYRSEEGKILHPCCCKLKKEISVEGVKFRLNEKVLLKCNWCNSKNLRGNCSDTRGWSYVSECKKYQFHVSCTIEMLLQDSLELKNFEQLLERKFSKHRLRRKHWSILKFILTVVASILLGDPTTILASAVVGSVSALH